MTTTDEIVVREMPVLALPERRKGVPVILLRCGESAAVVEIQSGFEEGGESTMYRAACEEEIVYGRWVHAETVFPGGLLALLIGECRTLAGELLVRNLKGWGTLR